MDSIKRLVGRASRVVQTTKHGPVTQRLEDTGYLMYFVDYEDFQTYVLGRVALVLVDQLRKDVRFYEGHWHWLHAEEVGSPRTEFRSYKNSVKIPGSMQIVVNTVDGRCYADIDRYNYEDVVNIAGHLFGEVLPWWVRRWFT